VVKGKGGKKESACQLSSSIAVGPTYLIMGKGGEFAHISFYEERIEDSYFLNPFLLSCNKRERRGWLILFSLSGNVAWRKRGKP